MVRLKQPQYDTTEMSNEREDFLEEDVEIPGQKYCLMSFLSPEKVLADKNVFLFSQFVKSYEFRSRTKNLEAYLMKTITDVNGKLDTEADALDAKDLSGAAQLCRNSKIRVDTLMDEFHRFVKANEKELGESKMKEAFDDYLYENKAKLEDDFYTKNQFRTTVRGLKIRGVYSSQAEAVTRSKKLQRQDTLHNIFVGEVGKWLPWDPEPAEVSEQEYAEEQLNTLMKKYKENEGDREQFQREQRARAVASSKKAVEPGITVLPDEGGHDAMFGSEGPADLAIARKAARDLSGAVVDA